MLGRHRGPLGSVVWQPRASLTDNKPESPSRSVISLKSHGWHAAGYAALKRSGEHRRTPSGSVRWPCGAGFDEPTTAMVQSAQTPHSPSLQSGASFAPPGPTGLSESLVTSRGEAASPPKAGQFHVMQLRAPPRPLGGRLPCCEGQSAASRVAPREGLGSLASTRRPAWLSATFKVARPTPCQAPAGDSSAVTP